VAHKEFEFEDELRVVAAFLAESRDAAKEKLGLKLAPNWALPHFWVSVSRSWRGQFEEARAPLAAGLSLDAKSRWALCTQVWLEGADKKWDAVIRHSQEWLKRDANASVAHYFLGVALHSQGKLREARDEYRAYLQGETQPEYATSARETIARLNEVLPDFICLVP